MGMVVRNDTLQEPVLPAKRSRDRSARAELAQETRARLLEAARTIFRREGYQAATLDHIAEAAGYTKGALYWHFENKQRLFLELIVETIRFNQQRFEQLLALTDADILRDEVAAWLDRIDEDEVLPALGLELEIEARRDPSLRALHQALVVEHEAGIAAFLQNYFARTGARPSLPVTEIAAVLITIFKGFALTRQNRPGPALSSAGVARLLLGLPTNPQL